MTQEFEYKEIDQEGMKTLKAIAEADKFNHWMYQAIADHCQGNILEIGSGIGNISEQVLADGKNLSISDIRQNYLDVLNQRFLGNTNLQESFLLDIVDPDFDNTHKSRFEKYDTIFAMNIVEHVKDDSLALKNLKKLLKPGGKVIILVPAYQALYNRFDEELEHYRRYSFNQLSCLITSTDYNLIESKAFNFMGIFGWWFTGSIIKKKTIPAGQMNLFNKLVPIFRLLDILVRKRMGLSVIAVGQKK